MTRFRQIKGVYRQFGLERGWDKCLELALRKVIASGKTGEIPNKRQQISRIVKTYIVEPSLLRNKIAHGQWKVALNRDNDAQNADVTQKLTDLDVIAVSIWLEAYEFLARIIEDLIESPNKTFRRDYWLHLSELEAFLAKSKNWTLQAKIASLRRKPTRN